MFLRWNELKVRAWTIDQNSVPLPQKLETDRRLITFFPPRKEKKENLVNLYTRIPFSIFYSSRPLFSDINQYFKHHIRNNENFYVPILRQYCKLASPWKMKNLPPSFPFLYHFHDAYYLSTWRGEKREELHHENVTLYSALLLDEAWYRDQVETCKGCNGRKRSKQRELNLTREYPFLFNTTHGSWPGLYRLCIHVRVSRALFDPIPRISRNKYFYNFYAVVEGSRAW